MLVTISSQKASSLIPQYHEILESLRTVNQGNPVDPAKLIWQLSWDNPPTITLSGIMPTAAAHVTKRATVGLLKADVEEFLS